MFGTSLLGRSLVLVDCELHNVANVPSRTQNIALEKTNPRNSCLHCMNLNEHLLARPPVSFQSAQRESILAGCSRQLQQYAFIHAVKLTLQ